MIQEENYIKFIITIIYNKNNIYLYIIIYDDDYNNN